MKFDLNSRTAGSTKRSAAMPASRSLKLAQKGLMTLGIAAATFMLAAPSQAQIILPARNGLPAPCIGACPPAVNPVDILNTGVATLPTAPKPFDIVGAIQTFTAAGAVGPNSRAGGTIRVNGITVTIPTNLVITMPANYLTVGQLFSEPGLPLGQSGLALADVPPPIAAYEVTIAGNIVNGVYIAGLVSIAQQSLNIGAGVIRAIKPATGELCVGPTVGPCAPTDARVLVNDPTGRYSQKNGVSGKANMDSRFQVDADNPTIHAGSGFPMCVPRVLAPGIDPKCPDTNRPSVGGVRLSTFGMSPAQFNSGGVFPAVVIAPCPTCNINEQAPLVVGDYINYSGVLARDAVGPAGLYIAAYSIEANVGIYTPPGAVSYMYMDAPLLGTGPAVCPVNAECQARLRTSIRTTDVSGAVPNRPAIYAVDEALNGVRTVRALPGTLVNTAQVGRWVFATDKDTNTFGGAAGRGATREMAALPEGTLNGTVLTYSGVDAAVALPNTANGLKAKQYVSPVGEFIFPEAILVGGPLTPYNFRCLQFLATGWAEGVVGAGSVPIPPLFPFPEAAGTGGLTTCGG
jgi:hypothetical protein